MKRQLLALIALLAATGCGTHSNPSAPSGTPAPAPVVTPVPPATPVPSNPAVLTVDSFTVAGARRGELFTFRPQLRLAETSGETGVWVTSLDFRLENIGPAGNTPKWGVLKRVNAGEVREMISPDIHGDYEFEIESRTAADLVSVNIAFTDDAGHTGSLSALAEVSR